jgi:hypothetical protein
LFPTDEERPVENFCVVRQEVVGGVTVGAEMLHASVTPSRSEAEAAAEAAAKAHQEFGFDSETGCWWGRNTGGNVARFSALGVAEAQRIIDEATA